jgi:hypothetical protein
MKVHLQIIAANYLFGKTHVENLNTKALVPKMMLRRRMTDLAKVAAELSTNVDFSNGRIVYGTSFGEIPATANILNAMYDKTHVSPTDFQNSVNNTAVSYLSLIQNNTNEITTISSGDNTSKAVLDVTALKALEGDEILAMVVEGVVIENIEQLNDCVEYLEGGVALKVKMTQKPADIDMNDLNKEDFKGYHPSVTELLYLAKAFENGKSVVEVEL